VRILEGHVGAVRAVAYSPDGLLVASGGDDGHIRLWPIGATRPKDTFAGHSDWVRALAFSPGGKDLASAGWDNSVKIRRNMRRDQLHILGSLQGGAWSLAFSPVDDLLVMGGGDGLVGFYRLKDERERRRYEHRAPVSAIAFTRDGKTVVTASHDRTIKLWDPNWDRIGNTLSYHEDWVRCVALARDGKKLISGSDDGILILARFPEGEPITRLEGHSSAVAGVTFGCNDQLILSVGWDGTARTWETESGREIGAYRWDVGRLLCLAVAPDGMTAAAGGESGAVVMWDLEQ
jgi:WD40 repeat protein